MPRAGQFQPNSQGRALGFSLGVDALRRTEIRSQRVWTVTVHSRGLRIWAEWGQDARSRDQKLVWPRWAPNVDKAGPQKTHAVLLRVCGSLCCVERPR